MSETDRIRCDFCEHRCNLADGQTGRCAIRRREGDRIVTVNYGEHVSLAVDPIEKKPLYHFYPGVTALSSALFGCNMGCEFCQNYAISQPRFFGSLKTRYIAPAELAGELQAGGHQVAAFTYSEPSVWQDYMLDAAGEVRRAGGSNVMITNGFFTRESLQRFLPLIDAFNIDLKGGEAFYRSICKTPMAPVLRNIREIAAMEGEPVLEVTTMLLEGVHTEQEIMELAGALDEAGVAVWHLSSFRPTYNMGDWEPTSETFLERIYRRAKAETTIPFIYCFSRRHREYEQTFCPKCATLCIDRLGFEVRENRLRGGLCPSCATKLYGRF
ncbi:MAG: AmmeMemoRadiSam system radical SAM enzyme [Alkalispirochaetaceae bacterium]